MIKQTKELWGKLEKILDEKSYEKNALNDVRSDIFKQCVYASDKEQGFFELSVPTGGGKTLSSFRFAVGHAKKHNLERIIFVIPFLNILEQNAQVIKGILKENAIDTKMVLESHSNVVNNEVQNENDLESDKVVSKYFNNWDEPIVFTTMVQFLENVYGGGTNAIRRFHNMANAVLIFDEIQALPSKCVYVFNLLAKFLVNFAHSTILLCSATQPPLDSLAKEMSLPKPFKIVDKKYEILKRTKIINKVNVHGGSSFDEIKEQALNCVKQRGNCLVIVNTKASVGKLFKLLEKSDVPVFCLSTNLCAEHRLKVIDEIKDKLAKKQPVICISTNLIEAGVDIDFATVIRFIAGVDNIIQSAGRCNREGKLTDKENNTILGEVYLYNNKEENIGSLAELRDAQKFIITLLHYGEVDFFDEEVIRKFYKSKFYESKNKLSYPIPSLNNRTQIELLGKNENLIAEHKGSIAKRGNKIGAIQASFKTASQNFKVIDNNQISLLVPFQDGIQIIEQIKQGNIDAIKRAQRYMVNVYTDRFRITDAVQDLGHGILSIKPEFYDDKLGVVAEFVNQNLFY